MNEQLAIVNTGIELCYESFGDPADPTILLVMGLATQMIAWDEAFCALLVERGFHVVRYDNRDAGPPRQPVGRACGGAGDPGRKLVEVEGMGHDLPAGAWPQIVDAIVATAARAATHSPTAAAR